MRVVNNTLEKITLENIAPKNVIPEKIAWEFIALEDIAPEDIIAPENITEEITLVATQDNYNQAFNPWKCPQKESSVRPGDKVAIVSDFDNNQKTRKRKLDQTCSITEKVINMCSNNRTVRVEVDGE
ncbi:42158_t:CDS:2, partial [Gigaspora margarita]